MLAEPVTAVKAACAVAAARVDMDVSGIKDAVNVGSAFFSAVAAGAVFTTVFAAQ